MITYCGIYIHQRQGKNKTKQKKKRESRDKERQSPNEPGIETTEKPPARMARIFC